MKDDTNKACPAGHVFGRDHDRHDACDDCEEDIYQRCGASLCELACWSENLEKKWLEAEEYLEEEEYLEMLEEDENMKVR